MSPARIAAFATLVITALFAAATLSRVDWKNAVETSPLALIPDSDKSRELSAVRQLAGDSQSRAMLALIESPSGHAAEAAEAARASLEKDTGAPGLVAVNPHDMTSRRASGVALFENRFALLLPRSLAEAGAVLAKTGKPVTPDTLAAKAVDRLDAFLKTDAAFAFEKLLPKDPLLLIPDATAPLLKEAGPKPPPERALLWIDTGRPPLSSEAQAPVLAALERARAAMRERTPDATMVNTGVNIFAAESERGIRKELALLNGLALVGVELICALALRRMAILPHLAIVTTLATGCAWSVSLLVFGSIHVFAVALGALLSGVCVDYTLYVLLHDGADGRPASFDRLKPMLRPLLSGGLVATCGFAFLALSPLPAIRQTGLFTASGLLAALALSVAYGSLVRFRHKADKETASAPRAAGRLRRTIAFGALALAAAGLPAVRWNDNLRDLEYPLPALRETDKRIRGAFGESSRSLWLVSGKSCGEAISHLRAFSEFSAKASGGKALVRGPLTMLATPDEHRAADAFVRRDGAAFATALRAEMSKRGYDPADFSAFFGEWEKLASGLPEYESSAERFLKSLTGPESMLVSLKGDARLLVCWTDAGATLPEPPPETGAFPLNRLESLNRTLAHYRANMLGLVLAGFACTVLLNLALLRRIDALRDFATPVGVALAIVGLAGWTEYALSIFHLAGAFLALCCSLNYSVFAREARRAGKAFPIAVTLAWAATSTSFGALCFSSVPAVHALGGTVLAIVTGTYLMVRFNFW